MSVDFVKVKDTISESNGTLQVNVEIRGQRSVAVDVM